MRLPPAAHSVASNQTHRARSSELFATDKARSEGTARFVFAVCERERTNCPRRKWTAHSEDIPKNQQRAILFSPGSGIYGGHESPTHHRVVVGSSTHSSHLIHLMNSCSESISPNGNPWPATYFFSRVFSDGLPWVSQISL